MPIASSGAISIGNAAGTDRSINVEVGRTQNTANSSMTAVVTAATTGTTPRGSGSVTDARPHAFSEWHSYTHAAAFTSISYSLRTGSDASVYGMRQNTEESSVETECTAEGGLFLTVYSPSGQGYTKIFGDVMKLADTPQIDNAAGTINRRYNPNASYVTMGSFANNTNPTELISIPVEGVTVAMGGSFLSGSEGTGFPDNQVTGLASGHTLIAGSAKGADDASVSGNDVEVNQAWFKYQLTISKSGYTSTTLNDFVAWSRNQATAEDEEN